MSPDNHAGLLIKFKVMKKIQKITFTIILFSLTFFCGCKKKERTLIVTINESINREAQWVYWFSLYGNEYNIIDSCFIERGQTKFVLKDIMMNDSIELTHIVFSEAVLPWEYAIFRIDTKDRDIQILNLTSVGLYNNGCTITGALAEDENRKRFLQQKYFNDKILDLKDSLMCTNYNDTLSINKIVTEMEATKQHLRINLLINQFDSVQSTTTISYMLSELSQAGWRKDIPQKTVDSIAKVLEERYPDDIKVREGIRGYIRREPTPPASSRSKYWMKRKDEIRQLAYIRENQGKSAEGNSNLPQRDLKVPGVYKMEPDTTNIPVYTIGSKLGNLKLKDRTGNYVSVLDLTTDYILIDFWATWCIACVRRMPELVKLQEKYKNDLSVYAISIDNTEREWIETIEKYKARQFSHVYAGTWTKNEAQIVTKSFGVTAIPSNFLIDKNRKIIAVDLWGASLESKLNELIRDK